MTVSTSPVNRSRRGARSLTIAATLAATVVATACTGPGSTAGTQPAGSQSAGTAPAGSQSAGSQPTGSHSAGTGGAAAAATLTSKLPAATKSVGTITWDLPHGEPATIDPAQAVDYSPDFVASNLCDPLLRENPDYTISPNLATYKQVTPLKLVLTLRAGVKFWDGHPVTATDAAYSMSRIFGNPNAPSNFLFQFVKSITATGPLTVTVTFSKPDELFVKELSSPSGMVIEKAYAQREGAKLGTAQGGIMCSGPYELKSWQPGSSITLTANAGYWNAASRPKAATVKISFVTDTAAITAGLLSGEFDGAYELPASVIPRLKSSTAGTLTFGPSPQSLELNLAHAGGVTASTALRKAIMTGIDRAAIAQGVYNGSAQPNYTSLAQTAWDPAAKSMYATAYKAYQAANAYDPARTTALVKQSGYAGQTLTLAILSGDATQLAVAQVIQAELGQAGIKIAIDQMQPIAYSNASYEAAGRKGIDLMLSYNFNQVADPLEYIGLGIQPGGPYNYTNFASATAWSDMTQARQTFDPAARTRLILGAQALAEADYSGTSLVETDEVSFLSKSLTGATTSFPYMFEPTLAYIGGK
jgi:peptide/nickel transport system substrate-binding protein